MPTPMRYHSLCSSRSSRLPASDLEPAESKRQSTVRLILSDLLSVLFTRVALFVILEGAFFAAANYVAYLAVPSDFDYEFAHTSHYFLTLLQAGAEWLGIVAAILFFANGIACLIGLAIMGFWAMIVGD